MKKDSNVKPFSLNGEILSPPQDLAEGEKFLLSVEDWSMSEPFSKNDIIQVKRVDQVLYDIPVVILADGRLYLCYLEEDDSDGRVEVCFADQDKIDFISINDIRMVGQPLGILRI